MSAKTWRWIVETVEEGQVVKTEERTTFTFDELPDPWRPTASHSEEHAFDLLKLPAELAGARCYTRARLAYLEE